jgi:putative PIN family toxin of toxin-antitoxin system
MKIVIDSNVWISVLINKEVQYFLDRIISKDIEIISSRLQVDEIVSVFKRPKLKKYLTENQINEFFTIFLKVVTIAEIKEAITTCRDPKDNFILETALGGGADCIITADNDLLILNPFRGIRILTMQEFIKNNFT